jgi:methionyl-tRNA synthetase
MGKDNITFHSQIWPAELLAYDGRGSRGGEPGQYGQLNLPTEVVSSEFLTMEGRKFSSSKAVVIYVRDVLSRYQADALRYFISAAGPENQDSDFTWAEFVRRTNDELVAGWGNLVNRTASMIASNFGEIPPAGQLTADDRALLDQVAAAFGTVGDLISRHRQKQALTEAMRTVGEVNKYVSDMAPWALAKSDDPADRERLATILHVTVQAVSDCNLILSPFLPHAANDVDRLLGGKGEVAPMPVVEEVEDLDGGPSYPILTGEYSRVPRWEHTPVAVGTPIGKPTHVFTKLDQSVVDEELRRLGG